MSYALESKHIDRNGNLKRERSLLGSSEEVLEKLKESLRDSSFSDAVIVQQEGLPQPAKEAWD